MNTWESIDCKYESAFRLDKLTNYSLIQLRNFLNEEQYIELEKRENGFFEHGSGASIDNWQNVLYSRLRHLDKNDEYLDDKNKDKNLKGLTKSQVEEKYKKKLISDIKRDRDYVSSIVKGHIIFDIQQVANDFISAISSEYENYYVIHRSFITWTYFCQDYIRLTSYWEFTGALVYGEGQYEQLLLFFFKTQNYWASDDPILLNTRNTEQFQNTLKRLKHPIRRYFA